MPMKDEIAIVMVEIGPASDIGMFRLSEKRVGSQFLVAHPGRDVEAKKNRMAQNAMLEKIIPKLFSRGIFVVVVVEIASFLTESLFSRRQIIRIAA